MGKTTRGHRSIANRGSEARAPGQRSVSVQAKAPRPGVVIPRGAPRTKASKASIARKGVAPPGFKDVTIQAAPSKAAVAIPRGESRTKSSQVDITSRSREVGSTPLPTQFDLKKYLRKRPLGDIKSGQSAHRVIRIASPAEGSTVSGTTRIEVLGSAEIEVSWDGATWGAYTSE